MAPESTVEKLPVVQIGAGFWGSSWARLVMNSSVTSLAGLVDHNAERLRRVADELGIPEDRRFARLEDALERGEARAALIVSPPAAHHSAALQVIAAGLHCLVEKPFMTSMAEGREVVAAAALRQTKVMVGQTYRFRRGPATVKGLIERGAIGRVESVHGRLIKDLRLDLSGWRSQMKEPIIVDQAVHHFDFVRDIFGLEPELVRAYSFNPTWSWFDGNACASVEFRTSDCYISYFASWVSRGGSETNTSFDGSWEVQGERGSIAWAHNRVLLKPIDLGDVIFYPGALEREGGVLEVPLVELRAEERMGVLTEFASAVRDNREPISNGADNLNTLALVFAAEKAVSVAGWRDVRDLS